MTISKSETQVTWSSSNSTSVNASNTATSDAFSLGGTVIDGAVQLKANHSGTPGSGDTVEFYLLASVGDPDGTGSNEYDTTEQGTLLAVLDTNEANPVLTTVPLPTVSIANGKIYAVNNAGESITVSAALYLTTSS